MVRGTKGIGVWFFWGSVKGTKGTGNGCGQRDSVQPGKGCDSSADRVMVRVIRMKGTGKGCGSSWDEVIGMKSTSKGCGSSAEIGCGQRDEGHRETM